MEEVKIEEGFTYKIPYPFCSGSWPLVGNECPKDSWYPGTIVEDHLEGHGRNTVYDEMGFMVITVVSITKIPGWPTRCFYTRHWIDPDGKEFGKKSQLRVNAIGYVTRLLKGHRYVQMVGSVAVEKGGV